MDPEVIAKSPILVLLDLWQVGISSGIGALLPSGGDAAEGAKVVRASKGRHRSFFEDVLEPVTKGNDLLRAAGLLLPSAISFGMERLAAWKGVRDEMAWWFDPGRLPALQRVLDTMSVPTLTELAGLYADHEGLRIRGALLGPFASEGPRPTSLPEDWWIV